MRTRILAFALFAATASVVLAYPLRQSASGVAAPPAVKPPPRAALVKPRPKVEVVFVLDTTGSMSGLIDAAKENIWSIATSMASAQPAPEIRMGLVAFRDRGDAYVTQRIDLSPDLDSMYSKLMDLNADGGGDGPESVNQALNEAVTRLSWSQDANSYKVVFLVGDAPPHMDYPDDVKYPETVKLARARGIVVNTIQAGDDPQARGTWQQIASLNQGEFFQVAQAGDAVAMHTPFDERLAALSQDLDATRLFYGDAAQRRKMEAKSAATAKLNAFASAPAKAKRAEFNASASGAGNLLGERELVDDVSSGRIELDKLAAGALPEPLQALSKQDQAKLVRETAEKRAAIQTEIATLARQRQDYIGQQLKESDADEKSLDSKIYGTIRAQAAAKGLAYEAAPKY